MFSSLTETWGFSESGGTASVRDHVAPLSVDTSTTTGHEAPVEGLMGHDPTTAQTSGPMALTSETTGPTAARAQVRPPSDVTHNEIVPEDDGAPPQRYPCAASENSNCAGKRTGRLGSTTDQVAPASLEVARTACAPCTTSANPWSSPTNTTEDRSDEGTGVPGANRPVWESKAAKFCGADGRAASKPITMPSANVPAPTAPRAEVARRRRSAAARASTEPIVRAVASGGVGSSRCSNIVSSSGTSVLEVLTEMSKPARRVALHRSGRAAEGIGHVELGPVRQVAQHHDLALAPGQASKREGKVDALGEVRLHQGDGLAHRSRRSLSAPEPIDGEVRSDGDDPTLGVVLQTRPPHVGARQRLLGDVFGVTSVAEDAERHPVREPVEVGEGLLESHRLGHGPLPPRLVHGSTSSHVRRPGEVVSPSELIGPLVLSPSRQAAG